MATNATLGNVQYSILNPSAFTAANGQGWVLMDGRDITGSDLNNLTGMTKIPDGRGVFIRSMNADRTDGKGDANDRTVGVYQADAFKQHAHVVGYPYGAYQFTGLHTSGADSYQADPDHNKGTSGQTGDSETRPRNICLYLYIKINN